jgi:hypothetical protein
MKRKGKNKDEFNGKMCEIIRFKPFYLRILL